jgi:amidophosphoribosyltransferase
MCGIVGIVGKTTVAPALYDALTMLQHRGQDAAGIATLKNYRINLHKGSGLVRDVFDDAHMAGLKGKVGIGHVRYPTAGMDDSSEAQPFYVNSPYGIALGHNGNLINTDELSQELFDSDRRHLNTRSDSEVLLNVLAHELQKQNPVRLTPEHIFTAVDAVYHRCRGAYSAVALICGHGIIGFRDPNGIRPMVIGSREGKKGTEYMLASESVALDALGFELIRDVRPGECVFITLDGQLHISVYKARLRMGQALARKILRERPEHDIDVVIPVPDTSRTAALPLAYDLDVKYREGFIKNRYIGRTFIMPGQKARKKSVKQKLNAIDLEFRKKNVLIVDDSIVRGTTSKKIIQMAREAGARKVYFASASPPVRYPNIYGIDMPAPSELVASGRTVEQIEKKLGADWLIYQELPDLIEACREGNEQIKQFDTSCFSGEYITGVQEGYLERLQVQRSDKARSKRRVSNSVQLAS